MKGFKSVLKSVSALALVLSVTSCATHLPEFQDATSLRAGEHRIAAGAYAGAGGTSNVGGSVMHAVGVFDRVDWTSQVHAGYTALSRDAFTYTVLTGPKFSTYEEHVALAVPFGISTNPDDGPDLTMFMTTPTLYWTLNPLQVNKNTIFIRSEAVFAQSDRAIVENAGWVSLGFRRSWQTDRTTYAWNVNATFAAAYAGLTVDL